MHNLLKKIKVKKDINELLFAIILFNSALILITNNMFGESIYNIIFKLNIILSLIISLIANKWQLIKKSDLIFGIIIAIMFGIDYGLRKNALTFNIYLDFIQFCFIPCYFFSRVKDYNRVIDYMGVFAKVLVIIYIFDALFSYYFTINYMSYGFGIILPSFFAIYISYIKNRNKADLIYLLLGFIAIIVYANRTCLLSTICLIIFTSFNFFSKRKEKGSNKGLVKKSAIVVLLFTLGFAFNYTYHNFDRIIGNTNIKIINKNDGNIDDNINVDITDQKTKYDGTDLSFKSYAIDKYSEGFDDVDILLSGRKEIYMKAIDVIKKDVLTSPLTIIFGMGTGYFRSINDRVYTHNIVFDLIIEYGLFGLFIMLGVIIYCFIKLLKNRKNESFYLLGCMFLFLAFPKLLLSTVFQKEYSLWLFILLVLSNYPMKFITKREKQIQTFLKKKHFDAFFRKSRPIIFIIILLVISAFSYIYYYNLGDSNELSIFNKNKIIDVNDFIIKGSTNVSNLKVYLNNKMIDSVSVQGSDFQYKIKPELLKDGWNYIEFRVSRFMGINEKCRGGAINNIENQPDVYIPDYTIESARKSNLKNRDSYYLDFEYDYYKNYIGAGNLQEGLDFHFDDNGIPKVEVNNEIVYQPVFISAYALNMYKEYLDNNDTIDKEKFLKMADWFVNNSKNGALEYPTDWTIGTIELKKGWVSSMAEGRALSVLARAYYLTGDTKYLKSGNKILNFMVSSADINLKDGTRKSLSDFTSKYEELEKYNEYYLFESHVGKPSSYCLNGNLFALLGLYDWYRLDKSDYGSNKAKINFDMGIKSIEVLLPYYDYYGWSSYGLNQYSNDDGVNLGNKYAHRCHLQLLYIFWTKTQSTKIKEYVDRFLNYYQDDFWIQTDIMYMK